MTFTPPSIEDLQGLFPNYFIEGFIAQGGMGAIYLGRQISLDRPVAIKILPDVFGNDEDYRISFAAEARAMAKLNHKNLVGIYDFGEMNGMLYIVMEFVPGRTLHDIATDKKVEEKEAARLISAISLGLDYAHNAGLIHRDIKPANILIGDDIQPKIVDFGLARSKDEQQTEGVVLGTPGYTAPEIIEDTYPVDHRSDIFSTGVILYELLTGRIPDDPIIPASKLSKTDPRFDIIINKSIHSNPNERYDSAKEFSDALCSLLENFDNKDADVLGDAGSENSESQSEGTVKRSLWNKKKSNVGVFVLLILAIGGGVGGMWYKLSKENSLTESKESISLKDSDKVSHNTEKVSAPLASSGSSLVNETKEERESKLLQAKLEKVERKHARTEDEVKELTGDKSRVNIKNFLKEELAKSNKKIKVLNQKAHDLMEPEYDKMGEELKTQIDLSLKGNKGVQAKKWVDDYLKIVKKYNNITPLPAELSTDLEADLSFILKGYDKKRAVVMKNLVAEIEVVRASYLKHLDDKKTNLVSSDDLLGVSKLDRAISAAKDLPSFLMLFRSAK